jgi:hypothetical protein
VDTWLCSVRVASNNYQLGAIVDHELSNFDLTNRHQYGCLKQRTELALGAIDNGHVSEENVQDLIDSITASQDDSTFTDVFSALTSTPPIEESKAHRSWAAKVKAAAVGIFAETPKEPSTGSRSSSDRDFVNHLKYLADAYPVFKPVVQAIKEDILVPLKETIEAVHKIVEKEIKKEIKTLDELREQVQEALSGIRSRSR